jgi:hypothetical protein
MTYRKVDYIEGEKLAKDNTCLFFEVSAKEDTNVQKMLYFSIAELPFFEQYKVNMISDLVGVLEKENNESKINMSSSIIDSSRYDIQVKNTTSLKHHRKTCKC